MGVFPLLGHIDNNIVKTINNNVNNNAKTSELMTWIRISSAAGQTDKEDTKTSMGLILESAPADQGFNNTYGTTTTSGRVGVDFNRNSVYADANDRGHRPSPIISNLSVSNGARGLSRKSSFDITCFSLGQVNKLSQYFLKPTFIVLVEFGWNANSSTDQKATLTTKDGPCNIAKFNNFNEIDGRRTSSSGTYDGFMGFITGGDAKSGDGETYILSVELTTLGEIPAYLQVHKSGTNSRDESINKTGLVFDDVEMDTSQAEADTYNNPAGNKYGQYLFKLMYNRLPAHKQIKEIRDIVNDRGNEKGKDSGNRNLWIHPSNFINMDPRVATELSKNMNGKTVKFEYEGNTVRCKIPKGTSLISDYSYIRLELAFKILRTYVTSLESVNSPTCKKARSYKYYINTDDTVIRAHKNIFSTDPTKLYIPNLTLPDFGLASVLASSDNLPADISTSSTIDGCIFDEKEIYAFPALSPRSEKSHGSFETTQNATEWGYLRNLYINFDFFVEVLNRHNYIAKDCYYELLNGISAAVNSYWDFEIQENPNDETGEMELIVRDVNTVGKISNEAANSIPVFNASGIHSPFLSSNLSVNIPGIMRNHIIGRSYNIDTQVDSETAGGFFDNQYDPTSDILNSFSPVESATTNDTDNSDKSEKEKRKHNFDLYMQNATIIPSSKITFASIDKNIFSRAFVNGKLSHIITATWADTAVLSKIKNNTNSTKTTYSSNTDTNAYNSVLLPIEFEFEIIGVSGIKIGDLFMLTGVPLDYAGKYFQVIETSHNLSDMMWKTTINARLRNIIVPK